jgi:hypothetical protein
MNRVVSALLALLTLGALASPARAYIPEESQWNPASVPIHYRINTASIPASIASTGVGSLEGGHTSWSGPACTAWRATDDGSTTTPANASDRQNVYTWLSGSWPADLGSASSVIGVTTPVWTVGGYFIDADIRFNAVGFTWSTTGAGSTVDTQSIATHEEGHFLGLGHPPVTSAIMYASYSGGIKRTLGTDDTNGVCFLYPSGVAPVDAGVPPIDAGGSTDRCVPLGGTCDTCTPNGGCGWCGATSRCITGTGTTAPAGCATGWAWYPSDCAGGSVGTGRFGDPCNGPSDCASGGECVSTGGAGFCTRACADDCSCPASYTCVSSGTLTACVPGSNTCPPTPVDAGTTPVDLGTTPPVDLGTTPPADLGTTPPPSDLGAGDVDLGPGSTGGRLRSGGCCSVPGESSTTTGTGLSVFAFFAILGIVRARRRRSRA